MELGLHIKITKTRHDMTSVASDFQFAKDAVGPVFFSKETDTKFILNAHLKGFKRKNIEIKISEDGSELWVSGKKTAQEMTMVPLKMKEEEEVKMREFKKMIKIPGGAVLDGIRASYNEDERMLTIVIPKMAKGIISRVGIKAEEEESSVVDQKVKTEEEVYKGRTEEEESSVVDQKVKKEEEVYKGRTEEEESSVVDQKVKKEEEEEESVGDEVPKKSEEEETSPEMKKRPRKPRKPCFPLMFGGSTFLLSLILLVIHYVRLKHK